MTTTTTTEQLELLAKLFTDAGLQSQVLFPADDQYQASVDSYWSNTNKLKPACFIRPESSTQVAKALRALISADEKFAIRSSGHSPSAEFNNIPGGVTIDLGLLKNIEFNKVTETVSFGPGVRWKHVHAELEKYGYAVAGGRENEVGVGGFILGGGNCWMTGRRGFACDNVVSFEVVVADGRIITVDATTHPDLFKALKGGGNNFGIVTNFTMATYALPSGRFWGGIAHSAKEYIPEAIRMTVNFTNQIADYPDSSLITVLVHPPGMNDTIISAALCETQGVSDSPAFKEWSTLPQIKNTTRHKTPIEIGVETFAPPNYYTTWFILAFKNDERIIARAAEVHEKLVEDLKSCTSGNDFMTQAILQPLPMVFAERSIAAGGNVLGLERNDSNGILIQLTSMVQTADQREFAYAKTKAYMEELKQFAAKLDGGGLFDWIYLNCADNSQAVLESYGTENVRFMKDVANKYDPDQVFQKLCPGGFKLSKVEL